jgi:hypothetical protein
VYEMFGTGICCLLKLLFMYLYVYNFKKCKIIWFSNTVFRDLQEILLFHYPFSLHFTLPPGEIRSLALDGEEIELTGGVRLSLLRDRLTVFCGAAHARPDPPPQDTTRGQLFRGWGRSTSSSLVAANKQKLTVSAA